MLATMITPFGHDVKAYWEDGAVKVKVDAREPVIAASVSVEVGVSIDFDATGRWVLSYRLAEVTERRYSYLCGRETPWLES